MHRLLTVLLVAYLLGLTLAGTHVFAQATESILALEEVIVTATKREQPLQDVAVAVTALSDEPIGEARSIRPPASHASFPH